MMQSGLAAATAAMATFLLTASAALAFEPPSTSEFFGRFNLPEAVTIQAEEDGSVLLSAPPGFNGRVAFTLRDGEVPEPGSRSVAIDVTMVEDGGGWPDALVGFGLVHGFHDDDPQAPFSVGVLSPQDGGTLRLGQFTGTGFSIGQVLGSGGMAVGETVRLTMRERNGSLEFVAENGGTSQASIGSDVVTAGMAGGGRVGFILVSGGTYRLSGLEIEATN